MIQNLLDYYNSYLNKKGWKSRSFIENVIRIIGEKWRDKDIFIVEAPTGYGKTTISLILSKYSYEEEFKAILVYPTRVLLEDQYERIVEFIEDKKDKIVGKRYMYHAGSRYLIKPITLTTIDTLSLTLFGIPPEEFDKIVRNISYTSSSSLDHYLFSYASVTLSNIILDEVHLLAESTKSLNFLMLLLEHALRYNQKVILMTATLPSALLEIIKDYSPQFANIKLDERMQIIRFKDFYDTDFLKRNKIYNIYLRTIKGDEKYDKILELLKEGLSKSYRKVIIVFNTVKDAINFYNNLGSLNNIKEIEYKLLLHSRFNDEDRCKKYNKLLDMKNKDSYIIVATQSIEVGVDISSNLFITELAPASSLIQRLGRFLRYDNEELGEVYIWYEVDDYDKLKESNESKYKVYDYTLTTRTLEYLKSLIEGSSIPSSKFSFHNVDSYNKLLDFVYRKEDFNINKEEIQEYFNILNDIERLSRKSIEKFIELEGSFVRESINIPVIPHSLVRDTKSFQQNDIESKIVNLPIEVLSKAKIVGVVKESEEERKRIEITNEIGNYIKYLTNTRIKDFISNILKDRIIAFIINNLYDSELGLILDE